MLLGEAEGGAGAPSWTVEADRASVSHYARAFEAEHRHHLVRRGLAIGERPGLAHSLVVDHGQRRSAYAPALGRNKQAPAPIGLERQ